jgi:para-nitrobenzyl esterase
MSLLPFTGDARQNQPLIAQKNTAIVPTTYGKLRGYIHNGIYTFKGIPYATASRFMPPQKPIPWKDIRSSMTYGPTCPVPPQTPMKDEFEFPLNRTLGFYISENCLTLNIWSRNLTPTKKKPVMVWLHGGGFTSGSSIEFPSYNGENLSKKGDVIVVSINHRLNVLGFLDLSAYGDKFKHSANAGMMDLVAALKWIKENISSFGGDPGNVTIFGQSGGGAKVTCLLNTPDAKGLFHKAIIQSGSYLTHFIEPAVSQQIAAETLKQLGLQPDQADSLQTIPYDRLAMAGEAALAIVKRSLPESKTGFGLEWEPVHDGEFLPYQPDEPQAIRLSNNIPLLIGSCKNEYMPYIHGTEKFSMDSVKAQLQKKYGDKTAAYMTAVKKAYPGSNDPSSYIDIDLLFRPLVIQQANKRAANDGAPVYVYLFAWQSPVLDGSYKAFHCMDLPFVFNNIDNSEEMTGGGPQAHQLADKVSEAWTQFARTGNPHHKGLPDWPAYSIHNGATMILDNECQLKAHFDQELLSIAIH